MAFQLFKHLHKCIFWQMASASIYIIKFTSRSLWGPVRRGMCCFFCWELCMLFVVSLLHGRKTLKLTSLFVQMDDRVLKGVTQCAQSCSHRWVRHQIHQAIWNTFKEKVKSQLLKCLTDKVYNLKYAYVLVQL